MTEVLVPLLLLAAISCYVVFAVAYRVNNYSKHKKLLCYGAILLQAGGLVLLSGSQIHVGMALGYYSLLALVLLVATDWPSNFQLSWRILAIIAAGGCLLSGLPLAGHRLELEMTGFNTHFLLASFSYGFFLVALSQMVEIHLFKRMSSISADLGGLSLLEKENLVFRNIKIGFVVLTLTIATGIGVAIFAQKGIRLDHKTLFGTLTWLICAVLLYCRWQFGWRGTVALRSFIAAVVCLLLSYLGTITVLDLILQRS